MPTTSYWNSSVWVDPDVASRMESGSPDVAGALAMAAQFAPLAARIGHSSWSVLSALATIGSRDLTVARTIEPHLDALAIIIQSRTTEEPAPSYPLNATWGVYASSPPGTTVLAKRQPSTDSWTLTGIKPWCSLADRLSHALVTASVPDGRQQLFAVDLRQASVDAAMSQWMAHGLRGVTTGSVHLDAAEGHPVGPAGWYVERPGFAWGGIAVAAIWFGAAAALAGALWTTAAKRTPDQVGLMHMGSCDIALHNAVLALQSAARSMDDAEVSPHEAAVLAARTRSCVAEAAERVMTTVGHALGPGPLAFDAAHLQRVADLTLYVRQHHAERDTARLGSLIAP
ncbi:MAG: acyl-CoA dehydrogenase [Ornithinimicrobium sp.]